VFARTIAGDDVTHLPRRPLIMDFDSYRSPEAETLLLSGRERFTRRALGDRLLVTETLAAVMVLAAAGSLALIARSPRPLAISSLACAFVALLAASRVNFPVGSAVSSPTQIVVVPMLFVLPVPYVPLIVAAGRVLDLWPEIGHGRITMSRVFARIADSAYVIGPATVLILADSQTFSWDAWPVLLLAFAAQLICDSAAGLLRTWFAERILPRQQLQMLWLYATDLCLSCVGLVVAASAAHRPALVLLTLPMIAILGMFAREREQRLDHTLELSSAYRGTAMLLSDVVEADHEYTGVHSREVVTLSLAVADTLGLGLSQRLNVEFGALLHDVGKIRVSADIIDKRGKLDQHEWAVMREHTIFGQEMLEKVGGTLARVGQIVRSSHEHYDGAGYPDGLAGTEIPIESRIISACDAYNAMTTNRSYRGAMTPRVALEELERCAGRQFDPDVVAAIVRGVGLV
jgi:putative nucleotidyltransferase with HDIG domain